jgi:multiple sugar transport system ATP-binding protein
MSVFDNIAFALQIQKRPRAEIEQRVRAAAKTLELEDLLKRRPGQLSGGQRQRVAMGRAIVREPAVFLMDEPLSNLDAKLRVQMRAEIAQIQHRLGVTTIYVTHDQVEAMTMGDRVALLRDGVLQQVDTPDAIYNRPRNTFVAAFIGSPTMNLYAATLGEVGESGGDLRLGSTVIRIPAQVFAERPALKRQAGKRITVGVRPEDLADAALHPSAPANARLRSKVDLVEALGSDVLVHFHIDAQMVTVRSSDALEAIAMASDGASSPCIARFTPKSRPVVDGPVDVVVDTERLHFFDPKTGLAVRD